MKAVVCEMCGSRDVIKKDGYYVCQSCETKYTPEEARKLIVEGVVKIDNSDRLENLFEAARNAKSIGNYAQAKSFYTEILTLDPNSWEATYYSVYCTVATCRIMEIESAAKALQHCLPKTLALIESYGKDKERSSNQVFLETIEMAVSLHNAALNHYNKISRSASYQLIAEWLIEYLVRAENVTNLLLMVGDLAEQQSTDLAVVAWHKGLENIVNFYYIYDRNKPYSEETRQRAFKYAEKIRVYDENYTMPEKDFSRFATKICEILNKTSQGKNLQKADTQTQSAGCFVATAVYGSYDCPQVWTLRRFRDYTLAATWYGRAFICIYYAVSPTVVKWFGHTEWFKIMWKRKLDCMVANLNRAGVEDTPYKDKVW